MRMIRTEQLLCEISPRRSLRCLLEVTMMCCANLCLCELQQPAVEDSHVPKYLMYGCRFTLPRKLPKCRQIDLTLSVWV